MSGQRERVAAAWLSGLLLLAALVLVIAHHGEEEHFAELLRRSRPGWLGAAVALQLGTYACAAAVWQRALGAGGTSQSLTSLIPVGIAKLFADQALPSAGLSGTLLAVRAFTRRGVPPERAVGAMLTGLISYYVAYAIAAAAALGVLWRRGELHPLLIALAMLFSALAAGLPLAIVWLRERARSSLPAQVLRIRGARELLDALARAPRVRFRGRIALETVALQLCIFALDAATLAAAARAVGFPIPASIAWASFVVASVIATLAWLPGGLGTFEGSCIAMLHLHGLGLEASLAAVLMLRGLTFWLPMVPGLWIAHREVAGTPSEPQDGAR